MRKEFWFLVLILSSAVAFGQPAGFTPVASPETVKKELSAKAAALQSMKSKFTQDKNMQMLSEKITSSGSFSFKQPDKVRMEYQSPFTYLLVIDGDKVTIRDGQKTNSFSAGNNRMFTIINRVILDCVRGTVFSNTDFEHTVYSGKGEYLVVMKPLQKEMKQLFQGIHVFLDKADGTIIKLDLKEFSGDNTLITFTEKQLNASIPDSEFVVK